MLPTKSQLKYQTKDPFTVSKKTPNAYGQRNIVALVLPEKRQEKLLISILGKCELKINSHRGGQTHADGANVKGKCKDVESQISSLNDQALFVPCTVHNSNLLLCQAASLVLHGRRMLGVINRLYLPVVSSMER